MGPGADDPQPVWCVTVAEQVVGWADFDVEGHDWLGPGEVNVGYALHPDHRGMGYATRAVQLLVGALPCETATVLIDPANTRSLALAARCGFTRRDDVGDQAFFARAVPPMHYTDGRVTIRLRSLDDVEAHVAGTDDEQIRWLWPEHRDTWEAMSPEQRIEHVRGVMERSIAVNETGPKWDFGVIVGGVLVGHVDCDLANPHVPHGEANISYTVWPEHRGSGYAAAAARLVVDFVRDHTGAREVHVLVDPGNELSLRVARALGAETVGDAGPMVRHVLSLRS